MRVGYIRDSNKSTLMTLINKEHGFPIFDCGIATDDLEDLKKIASWEEVLEIFCHAARGYLKKNRDIFFCKIPRDVCASLLLPFS